ncbi:T9SS type A sorting domain-containing protein [Hymenobacter properus]|uniref:T9SS type A sorting domain-containing protein n=1 Tax=Hymenobacter properus TaxID=2791026 RepID=A0A931FKP3_9BACT|nr:T9SS type A sorting domain-containing protein [Hymenobacter properus]MBF9144147.1 T9SS type A sorting domain-containing protein [Hymenobacter properus]MBR7722963.1 T9SS type A sorting domain-containing protein [Microvirga sp. SRT04]
MKHLLLSLLLALPLALRAQSANPAMWCPAGATWTYGYALFAERGTITVRYARDTVVAGQPAQVLTRQLNSVYYPGPTPGANLYWPVVITRVVGRRVEVWAYGQFYTLYDFGALPGSTWPTVLASPANACPQARSMAQVVVDSVGTQQLAGHTLRWFRAHLLPTGASTQGYWHGRVYEQVGGTEYMQPLALDCPVVDAGVIGPVFSFRATGCPTTSFVPGSGTLVLGSAQARAEAAGFAVYPNPSAGAGVLRVALPAGFGPAAQLRLLDLTGRLVLCQPARSEPLLDVRGLAAGIYSLQLSTQGAASLVCRVVLE